MDRQQKYRDFKIIEATLSHMQFLVGQVKRFDESQAVHEINRSTILIGRYLSNIMAQFECAKCDRFVTPGVDGEDYYKGVIHFDCRQEANDD